MEPNEAMKAMARRVAQENAPAMLECLFGGTSSDTVKRVVNDGLKAAALAAIVETQASLMSALEDERVEIDAANPNEIDFECNALVDRCLAAIRTGEHYALAGDRYG